MRDEQQKPDFCLSCATRVAGDGRFCIWRGPTEEAILRTLAYSDVFCFPLNRAEMQRYHPAATPDVAEFDASLDRMVALGCIDASGPHHFLPGRQETVSARLRRETRSRSAWCIAQRWARVLWMIPFVRMVGVTGSLAANSMEPGQDIDYLLVVEPGKLWLARSLCLVIWCLARITGVRICPNYMVTTSALALEQHDLYTARELAQMAPLYGRDVATRLRDTNRWTTTYLPNAQLEAARATDPRSVHACRVKRWSERALLGMQVERLDTLVRFLLTRALEFWATWLLSGPTGRKETWRTGRASESRFSADVCKFHAYSYGTWVLQNYRERLALLGQADALDGGTNR